MRREPAAWCGIVLAAGRSVRMGRPKALLEAGGTTLLEHAVRLLREGGCGDVVVAAPTAGADVTAAARSIARVVRPPDVPDAPPLASLRHALGAVGIDAPGAVVLPVDCPFVRPGTVTRLLAHHVPGAADAVVPAWHGERGHPVVLGRALFARLRSESLAEGLRTLLEDPATRVVVVEVDDEAVTFDIDTPAEARRRGVDV